MSSKRDNSESRTGFRNGNIMSHKLSCCMRFQENTNFKDSKVNNNNNKSLLDDDVDCGSSKISLYPLSEEKIDDTFSGGNEKLHSDMKSNRKASGNSFSDEESDKNGSEEHASSNSMILYFVNSFSEEEYDDNDSEEDSISDLEIFRLLKTCTSLPGTLGMTCNSRSSSDSFSEEDDDANDSQEDVLGSEALQLLEAGINMSGTSEKTEKSRSSNYFPSEDAPEDKRYENYDASDSELSQSLEADKTFGLRGGGGSNFQDLESDSGPSQKNRRSSLITPTFRYDRQKPDNLFPPTKKYRYYPVTCEYCGKRFQPNKLKAHQKKRHFSEMEKVTPSRKVQSAPLSKAHQKKSSTSRSKSAGGIPRHLEVCYICGQLYGSISLKIHEPKCLEKWRIQNQQLPPNLRAAEPVKPKPMASVGTGKDDYDVPAFDPKTEAAFRSHLSTLIPCTYCSRTFSPDRILKHMSCCIERPRTRKTASPTRGKE